MVRDPSIYLGYVTFKYACLGPKIHHIPRVEPTAKLILEKVVSLRLQGKNAQASYKTLGTWAGRSPRTACYALTLLEKARLIVRKRVGKKLPNAYFIARWLWRLLAAGRGIRSRHGNAGQETPIDKERTKDLFVEIYAEIDRARRRAAR